MRPQHRELLDAAHITGDPQPHGLQIATNGLALCKIHHAAYDTNVLGIRPDVVVQIHERLLTEIDGPMLLHGLQGPQPDADGSTAPPSSRSAGCCSVGGATCGLCAR